MSVPAKTVDEEETTPLLVQNEQEQAATAWGSGNWMGLRVLWASRPSSQLLLILAAVMLMNFGENMPLTTKVNVLRNAVCEVYYASDPNIVLESGQDPLCEVAGVNSRFSGLMTIVASAQATGTCISFAVCGRLSSKVGRKPVFIVLLLLDMVGRLLLSLSSNAAKKDLEITLLVVWIVIDSISNLYPQLLMIYMITVDLTDVSERTQYFLIEAGLGSLGKAPSYTVGGLITSSTSNPCIVFYVASGISFVLSLICVLFLQESFGKEKRIRLHGELQLKGGKGPELSWPKRVASSIWLPIHILSKLAPQRNMRSGKQSFRLLLIAASYFLGSFVTAYYFGVLVYTSARFGFDAKKNGYLMTVVAIVQIFWLLLLSPVLLRIVDRLYQPQGSSKGGQEHSRRMEPIEETRPSAASRRDTHVVLLSYLLQAAGETFMGFAQSGGQFTAACSIMGLASSAGAAIKSIAAASVSPLQAGETLAALEMVQSIALLLAPLQGVLLTVLINKTPQVIFFTGSGISLAAALLVFCVRDTDPYGLSA